MNPEITQSHNEARTHNHGEITRSPSRGTASSQRSTHSNSSERRKEPSRVASFSGREPNVSSPHHDTLPPTDASTRLGWRPWQSDEPLRTKIPKSETTMEDWVKAMEASDDGMCKGWRDQIDTLIIFAGLFSATVTAFTVESYQWLEEAPADTLARLQLRILLNTAHDPAVDRLAPATFHVSSASVAINTLWFASLTLSLAAVVISILCKQWLYEYQRYDNFTTEEAFRIHGLRHRGLQAWRVPEIIASLPILLQTALVLFLVGILVLLWPLQTVVVSITTIIVGLTFLFLGITTALPSIQYIFPQFDTQCAYKSSQSWSFFFLSAFWLFDFGEFTSWALFDQWEVTCVYDGTGHTLFRVYKLLCNSVDAVLSVYSTLADTSLNPTVNADLALLSDFNDGLGASALPDLNYEGLTALQRLKQLQGCVGSLKTRFSRRRHKPGISPFRYFPSNGTSLIKKMDNVYYSRIQSTLSKFLRSEDRISHPALYNRYIEHWARSTDIAQVGMTEQTPFDIYAADIQYDPEIAMYLVELHSHLFKTDQFLAHYAPYLLSEAYLNLTKSYHQHEFNPAPVTLLNDIQEWIDQIPESDLPRKVRYAECIMFSLTFRVKGDVLRKISESHTSEFEKRYLTSFARFFVGFFEREDILQETFMDDFTKKTLTFLRGYLHENLDIPS